MPKNKTNTEIYAEIMSEIATRAMAGIAGVELLGNNPDKTRFIKDNDVHAYFFEDNNVNIDIYLNIVYGYNIPETVCKVQEAVKSAIEKETCYKVTKINVTVVSIVCQEDDDNAVEVVHVFSEDDDKNDSID